MAGLGNDRSDGSPSALRAFASRSRSFPLCRGRRGAKRYSTEYDLGAHSAGPRSLGRSWSPRGFGQARCGRAIDRTAPAAPRSEPSACGGGTADCRCADRCASARWWDRRTSRDARHRTGDNVARQGVLGNLLRSGSDSSPDHAHELAAAFCRSTTASNNRCS